MQPTDRFLHSVDIPDINPPPNWTSFTLRNFGSWKEGDLPFAGVFSTQFRAENVRQHQNGDLYVGGFHNAARGAVLDFLRHIKTERPQMEIVFEQGPKSPDLIGLAREGIRAILKIVHPLNHSVK
ncbi:hypothetical protein HZC21_02595 [Candidatus Peregrinibacteria bacterium]|nr:hypothetical protein [Candidatus Peregrinibacteria bacterium]